MVHGFRLQSVLCTTFRNSEKQAVIWTEPVSTICQNSKQHSHSEADGGQEPKLMYATVSFNKVYAALPRAA